MADLLRFIPLRRETLDDIRARIDADVNAGVDPEDADFIDTTPGGMYYDVTQALALEIERLWDMVAVDLPASMFLETTWGDYMDSEGARINVERKDATPSTGELVFSGTDGTLIPTGTEVSTVQADPDVDPVTFVATESGTISGGSVTLAAEAVLDPVIGGAAGNVAAAAVSLLLSGIDGVSAVTNPAAFTGGTDVESDEEYRARLELEYSAAQGAGSVADYMRWALAYPGIGGVRVAPLWNGAGTVRVMVTDVDNMPVSAAVRDGFQQQVDPYDAQTQLDGAVTLPTSTITVDTTAGFAGAGKIYVNNQLVTYTGKTATTFTGCTGGTGAQADNSPVVQSGSGKGLAPVGAIVTVSTPATLAVNIAATLQLEDGYSYDGADGTIAVQPELEAALQDYIDSLPAGGENPPGAETPAGSGAVLLNRVRARFFQVPGVYNITALTLNGSAADVSVAATQLPKLGTLTLT